MPELMGTATRGRKKEALRLQGAALARKVTSAEGTRSITVEVAPATEAVRKTKTEPGRKAEPAQTITFSIPKGAVEVPLALTSGKEVENVRETLRNGAKDAEMKGKVKVVSNGVKLDDGKTIVTIFHLESK